MGAVDLFSLTYDLYNQIIDDVVEAHAPLFLAMHQSADEIELSKALVEELKVRGTKEIGEESGSFMLVMDPIDDHIGGFRISLMATESGEIFEQIQAKAAADRGVSLEELEGFELENGLEMDEDIFAEIEESYDITAEAAEDNLILELVVFDSQDIDNMREQDEAWREQASL